MKARSNAGQERSVLVRLGWHPLDSRRPRLPRIAVVAGANVFAGKEDREDVRRVHQQQWDDCDAGAGAAWRDGIEVEA